MKATSNAPELEVSRGDGAQSWLDEVARLRIAVFREWPYMYAGTEASEREYLTVYSAHPASTIVIARLGEEVLGASTALPLSAADRGFQQPYRALGASLDDYFYCGESVLRPQWRGRGIGHRFFDHR